MIVAPLRLQRNTAEEEATRSQILRLKTPNSISAGALPQTPLPVGGAYSAPPEPLGLELRGLFLRGGRRKGKEREGKEWKGKGGGMQSSTTYF